MIKKTFGIIEKKISEDRVIEFLGSDDTKDRVGEVLTVDGWDTKSYKKNPVFLWAHSRDQLPIGKAISVKAGKEGLRFKIKFADADINPFADTVYKMYKEGYLNGVSVGFIPDYKASAYNDRTETLVTNKKELLELSAVPVGCNPNALMQRDIENMYEKGLTDTDIAQYKERYTKETEYQDEKDQIINEQEKKIDFLINKITKLEEQLEELLNKQEDDELEAEEKNIFSDFLDSYGSDTKDETDGELENIINQFKENNNE